MTDWPSTLPETLLANGLQVSRVPQTVVSQPDAGPMMLRRRFSMSVETASGSINLTQTQWTTLDTFFNTTLKGGSLPFNITHPVTGDTVVATFMASDPQCCAVTGSDGKFVNVSIKLQLT